MAEKNKASLQDLKTDLSKLIDKAIELEYEMSTNKDSDEISSVICKLTDANFILSKLTANHPAKGS